MRLFGFMGFGIRKKVMIVFLLLMPAVAATQSQRSMELHGLRPGMLTREIILHAQAPLDTSVWGGKNGQNTIEFKGEYLCDTGQIRVYVKGSAITQVTFIARQRATVDNMKAFNREMAEIKKLYGSSVQDYHNKYRIVSWESGGMQLNLTTADSGKFYSATLSNPLVNTGPAKK
jgi:hypothetical protein